MWTFPSSLVPGTVRAQGAAWVTAAPHCFLGHPQCTRQVTASKAVIGQVRVTFRQAGMLPPNPSWAGAVQGHRRWYAYV